ncbi:MAG: DUF5640 domain-containing protein [Candidatus Rokuibacteriota bacterium]
MTRRREATWADPIAAAFGIALVLAVAEAPARAETLVGRWDAEARSRGGLGTWWQFRADGTVSMSLGAMVDDRYRIDGEELTLLPDTAHAADQTVTMRITGDTLTAAGQTMRRVGGASPGDPPHVRGVWTYPHYTGIPAYVELTRDGRHLLRIPMVTQEGRFTRIGRTLRIAWTSGDVVSMAIRLVDETLILQDGSRELRYRRQEGSIPKAPQRGP